MVDRERAIKTEGKLSAKRPNERQWVDNLREPARFPVTKVAYNKWFEGQMEKTIFRQILRERKMGRQEDP